MTYGGARQQNPQNKNWHLDVKTRPNASIKRIYMLGAVLGDIIGSYYEWNNVKTKDFPLVTNQTRYTDDTVMTLAVAKWLLEDPARSEAQLIRCMQKLGRAHIRAGYGGRFKEWLMSNNPQPYNSWGNGSAMRVSPVGLFAESEAEARELARLTASITHNHPEGIKGAEAVAVAVFYNRRLARLSLKTRKGITKHRIEELFGYNLYRTLDEIRPTYQFDVSCQGSVPEAIIAYLESESIEDCVRNAISIGGDSDTIAAIACSIFMAGENCDQEGNKWTNVFDKFLPNDLKRIMYEFEEFVFPKKPTFNSYAVKEWLYAGEYPGDRNEDKAKLKLRQFKRFGITHFIDLTEEGELQSYESLIRGKMRYIRFPVVDQSIPQSIDAVRELIESIMQIHRESSSNKVYIHCWGGVGRTGTIVGCLLASMHGTDYEMTIRELRRLWSDCPKSATRVSPENLEQCNFIARFIKENEKSKETEALQKWITELGQTERFFCKKNALPEKTMIATANRWRTWPMPEEYVIIRVDITIPEEAMAVIRKGHVPETMEDHWFMYCDGNAIRYFRSWTGVCIFEAFYEKKDSGDYRITHIKVNRSENQYRGKDLRGDFCMFMYLLVEEAGGDASWLV